MKITFISLFPDLTAFGLRNIASYISKEGYGTQIIFLPDPEFERIQFQKEGYVYSYPEPVMAQVEDLCKGSDLIGISLFTCYFQQALQLTKRFKEMNIPVLWGGKHPSAMPEESLKYADMVCIGEGEEAVLKLVKKMKEGKDYYDTNNFCFNTPKGVVRNPLMPLTMDLDAFPTPNYTFCPHYVWLKDRERIEPLSADVLKRFLPNDPFSKGGKVYQTMTTRGCPYSCTYCYTFKDLYKGQKYLRQRSVEHLILELEEIKKTYDFITHVSLCDDEFLALKFDNIKEFAEKYKQRVGLHLSCLASPINIDEKKLDLLLGAGLRCIQMGIESVSTNGKNAYRRNIPNDKIMRAVNIINKYRDRIVPLYDFIIDNPYETDEDILDNLRFILKMPRPYHLDVFSLVFFPGTELYKRALKEGIIEDKAEVYSKVYRNFERRYLNLMFLLINYRVPGPIMRLLTSMPMVFIFERQSVNRIVFALLDAVKRSKARSFIKRLQILRSPHG